MIYLTRLVRVCVCKYLSIIRENPQQIQSCGPNFCFMLFHSCLLWKQIGKKKKGNEMIIKSLNAQNYDNIILMSCSWVEVNF